MLGPVWDFLGKKIANSKTVTSISSLFGGLGIQLSNLGNYDSYLQAGTKNVWASWKAIDLVGQVVQTTPFTITKRGKTDPVSVPELERLLKSPNPFTTYADLLYLTTAHIKYTGNAFWYKAGATQKGDRPKELYPLNPKRMNIVPGKMGVQSYTYSTASGVIPFSLDEIMHFKRPHPDNDVWGLGDFEAGEDLLNENINRSRWSKKFWRNGAAPSALLSCKDQINNPLELAEIKRRFQEQYGGEENAGKVAMLTGDWSMHKLGLTSVEMQEIDRLKINVEQLFHLHGVPLSVAGIRDAANFATAREDDKRFRRYTVLPIVQIIEQTQQSDLIDGFGDYEVKVNLAGLTDVKELVETWAPVFDRGGMSINEFRAKVGLEPKTEPLFEQHMITSAMTPLDLAGVANQQQIDATATRMISDFQQKLLAPNPTTP